MRFITIIYILNMTLLILHEIESGYEREWEILHLPGKLTGFLLLHVPILFLLFYGLLEIDKGSAGGLIMGIIAGVGGLIPFLVHRVFVYRKGHFNSVISSIIMYSNIAAGIILAAYSLRMLIG